MTTVTKPLPEDMQVRAAEIETYYRALPSLLADGDKDRFVVIKGDRTYGTWDTYRDAKLHAHELFPEGGFLAQRIDPRFLDVLAPYFGAAPESA